MPTWIMVPGAPYVGPVRLRVWGTGAGATPPPDPVPPTSASMAFNAAANSQYLILLEDI